ncbi:MAG: ATP-binding protein [Cyanobacteria bacterium SZAS-4]|nr:ATP-binding protein [Cyanobacteria bacterium SZAS-4]
MKAKEIFERYRSGGADFVQKIAKSGVSETLHLDFKEWKKDIKDDLSYFGKALSGFANAEGGLLVWGVECRRIGTDEPDVTQQATPISGLSAFANILEARTDEFIQPGISGVVHVKLELDPLSDTGFLLTYIPRAEGPPQMCIAKNHRGFYCRMGSRTKPMEHYQIADRFRERPQPRLEVFLVGGREEIATNKTGTQQVDVCVSNTGAGVAKDVAVALLTFARLEKHSSVQRKLNVFPIAGDLTWKTFALAPEEILYPGSFAKLAYFTRDFALEPQSGPTYATINVEYHAFCDGATQSGTFSIESSDIISKEGKFQR